MADNTVTLTSIAMLKVNFDTGSRDYIDYLVPFVCHVLAAKRPDPITESSVAEELLAEFAVNIPRSGVQLVLRRLAKRGILQREHGVFRARAPIPAPDITERRNEARGCIERVTSRLCDFVGSRYTKAWTQDEASVALLSFLSRFSIDCLRTYVFGTALPDFRKGTPSDLYLVGLFIREVHESERHLFGEVITVVKGQMLANALTCPDLQSMQRKFGEVTFYFDTPLVLKCLGFQDSSEGDAMRELLRLVHELGGETAVFEHTIEETDRVIRYCEQNIDKPDARSRIVYEMRKQLKTASDIALMRSRLPSGLARLGLKRRATPDYTEAYQIDEVVLEDALDEDVGYANPRALQYDINSIRSIYVLRKGLAPVRLEDAKAVLVTSNAPLARAAYTYGQSHECSREVSTVITDYSLANVAWLKAPLGAPGLPERELLAVCYAAMAPDEGLWTKYVHEIDRLRSQGAVSATDHEALRYSLRARDELMDLTLGDERAFTPRTVSEILDRVKSEYVAEQTKAVATERLAHDETRRSRDDLLRGREEAERRLFWFADRLARWGARSAFGAVAILLLAALVASPFATSKYVTGSYLLTVLANSLVVFGGIWGLMNWYFGLSVTRLARGIQHKVRPWAYRRLTESLLGEIATRAESPPE